MLMKTTMLIYPFRLYPCLMNLGTRNKPIYISVLISRVDMGTTNCLVQTSRTSKHLLAILEHPTRWRKNSNLTVIDVLT